jgi:hypothetical protein
MAFASTQIAQHDFILGRFVASQDLQTLMALLQLRHLARVIVKMRRAEGIDS